MIIKVSRWRFKAADILPFEGDLLKTTIYQTEKPVFHDFLQDRSSMIVTIKQVAFQYEWNE